MGVAGLFWFLYSNEWWNHPLYTFLGNVTDKEEVYNDIVKLHDSIPEIIWNIKCGHYTGGGSAESTSRGRTKGGYQETKYTHCIRKRFYFKTIKDISVEFDRAQLDNWELIELDVYKQWLFGNKETKIYYKRLADKFAKENFRDKLQEFMVEMKFDDFKFDAQRLKDNHKAYLARNDKNIMISKGCYCLCSCLLCSPCYRTWLMSKSGKMHYIIQKEITI